MTQTLPETVDRLTQTSTIPAFATYIDQYVVPDHLALNASLLSVIESWRGQADDVVASNHLGWHSNRSLFLRKEEPVIELRRHITSALLNSLKRYWPEFSLTEHRAAFSGWANVNQEGAFNAPHDHRGAHLSGVYFVSVPESDDEKSGALEFINPASAAGSRLPTGRPMSASKMFLRPVAGQLVIFPSHLLHWVYPNQEKATRASIAFNMRLLEGERPAKDIRPS